MLITGSVNTRELSSSASAEVREVVGALVGFKEPEWEQRGLWREDGPQGQQGHLEFLHRVADVTDPAAPLSCTARRWAQDPWRLLRQPLINRSWHTR